MKLVLWTALGFFCALPSSFAATAADLDQIVSSFQRSKGFMGSVLVVENGRTLLSKGYGQENIRQGKLNQAGTKFLIGSLTKQFTATLVMKLVEEGKLNLDAPISTYLPSYPQGWRIKVRHLLSHTSGIPDFVRFPEFERRRLSPTTLDKAILFFKDRPLEFTPGSKFNYSNSGYVLLGKLIEVASGKSYEEFLKQTILVPAGLQYTGLDSGDRNAPGMAMGYVRSFGGRMKEAPKTHPSWAHAAGAMYSTVEDLDRWNEALNGGRVVSRASVEKMHTANLDNYGFGWQVEPIAGHPAVDHSGSIDGFSGQLTYFPGERVSIAVLSNVDYAPSIQIAEKLAEEVFKN